ncbi:acylphosphatase-1 isoform X3 [Pan paniscus]|uniref:acylphosphatase-1 isoform X3 n=1 Tax=Pan paniscus TaxID=9597 RepID=UPI0024373681|nr:acylphosphatase-1 isoform X2 [Pan paniscus]
MDVRRSSVLRLFPQKRLQRAAAIRSSLSWRLVLPSHTPYHIHSRFHFQDLEVGERSQWLRTDRGLNMAEGNTLISVDYEIFGKVQGVFFRKHTQAEGKKLGLVGWVQNTDRGTVQGQLQGPISKVRHMQEWLETRGSPKSHIDKANFNNEKVILKLDYSDFQIVK